MIKEAGEVVTVENNPGFNPVAKSTFHVVVRPGAATASSDCNLNSNCRFDLPVVLAIKNTKAAPGSPDDPVCLNPNARFVDVFCVVDVAEAVNPVADAKFLNPAED